MIDRRLIRPYLLTLILAALLVFVVHRTAVGSILDQVRRLLAGVAASAAEGLMSIPNFGRDFQFIDGSFDPVNPHDPRQMAFHRMASHLARVKDSFRAEDYEGASLVPRIIHVYTLRRVRPTDRAVVIDHQGQPLDIKDTWQFVVAAGWITRDENFDGVITPDEEGVLPGENYPDGLRDPMRDTLELAMQGPAAAVDFTTDSWGTLLRGYAPLRDASREVIGVLGVDLSKEDLRNTLTRIRFVSTGAFFTLLLLITWAFHLLSMRLKSYEQIEIKDAHIEAQNRELVKTNERLAAANRQFADQLSLAKSVQQRFLPAEFPRYENMTFGSVYLACEAVGGDIYDVFPIDEKRVGMYIADVSGHGISAALISSTLKMSVEAMKTAVSLSTGKRGGSILQRPRDLILRLHDILKENLSREHFITIQVVVIHTDTGEITLCNAGHTWPVLYRADLGRAELFETNAGLPIGYVMEEVLVEQRITLGPGDKVLFYTDGLTETHGEDPDKLFGEERLTDAVTRHGAESAEELVHSLKDAADRFAQGQPSADDVALIVVERLAAAAQRHAAAG